MSVTTAPTSEMPSVQAGLRSNYRLDAWLATVPAESVVRLKAINASTDSARHIILSLAYGLTDAHIGKLNRIITALLISRLKAERAGKVHTVERINDFMDEMHQAIDAVCGMSGQRKGNAHVCGRARGIARQMG